MGGCPPTNHENSDMAFVARGLVPRHTPAEDKPRRYVAELFSEQISMTDDQNLKQKSRNIFLNY
jgi:hypothetical protein